MESIEEGMALPKILDVHPFPKAELTLSLPVPEIDQFHLSKAYHKQS